MSKITKETTIQQALEIEPEITSILMEKGMHCFFCGAAAAETIGEACQVHAISESEMEMMLLQINQLIDSKKDIEARRAAMFAEEDED